MRTSFGGTWLIQLMILFILLFAGYIVLTIEYSKNVRVKNEMISIVEKYDGLNEQSITLLNNYISSVGYKVQNGCEVGDGMYGLADLSSNELEETQEGTKYYYCVKKYKGANTSYYYQITVFYRFNLPILGDISGFTIKGTTTNFQSRDDRKYCMTISGPCRGSSSGDYTPSGGNKPEQTVYYNVSFDLNGGEGSIPTQSVRAGKRADQPKNPTRDGYRFEGWTLNGSSFDFYTYINSNITLVAKWSQSESYEPQTCEVGFYEYSNKKYFKILDASGREVSSVSAGNVYYVSFQSYTNGPLSSDADRITQQDLATGYGCEIKQIGLSINDNIALNNSTGIYNSNSDIDKNYKIYFKKYDEAQIAESTITIKIPNNYSGRTIKFNAIIQGLYEPIYQTFELKVN